MHVQTIPSDTTSIVYAYSKHSIRYNKNIKGIFKTFHRIQQVYMGPGPGGGPGSRREPGAIANREPFKGRIGKI